MSFFRSRLFEEEVLQRLTNLQREIVKMGTGLTALTQAVSDLGTAVTGATTELTTLVSELQANEDPAVQAQAAKIEAIVGTLNAAVTAAQTPPPASNTNAAQIVK